MKKILGVPFLKEDREPQTWEIAGAFLGYFGVINDVPDACRKLGIAHFVPESIKAFLLRFNPNPDFWYVWAFTLILLLLLFGLLWKTSPPPPDAEKDNVAEAIKYLKRSRLLRALKSFGLIPLRELIMDRIGIAIYGTFRRPSDWSPNEKVWPYLDRFTLDGGTGREYQYSKDFKSVQVREHPEESSVYGSPTERKPSWEEIGYLVVASWFFPFWLLIHLLRRPFLP